MERTAWATLVAMMLTACTVEDVIVDTGGGVDTGPMADTGPVGRPDRPEPDEPEPEPEPDPVLGWSLSPAEVERGATSLVFLEGPDVSDVVAVDLYGEPDASLSTWAIDGPDRLVLVVEVGASSPVGEVLVVVERADGSVERPEEPLLVR